MLAAGGTEAAPISKRLPRKPDGG